MYTAFLQKNVIYMKNVDDPKEFVKFYCIKSLVWRAHAINR